MNPSDLVGCRRPGRVTSQSLLPRLEKFLRPAIIQVLDNPLAQPPILILDEVTNALDAKIFPTRIGTCVEPSIGEDLGPFAERSLRKRIENARVFLARIDEPLSDRTKEGARTIAQFEKLPTLIDEVIERPDVGKATPCHDRMNLVLAVKAAAEGFHDAWLPRLGLDYKPGAFGRGAHLLRNRIYRGEVVNKGIVHPAEHQAVVDEGLWGRAGAAHGQYPDRATPPD